MYEGGRMYCVTVQDALNVELGDTVHMSSLVQYVGKTPTDLISLGSF